MKALPKKTQLGKELVEPCLPFSARLWTSLSSKRPRAWFTKVTPPWTSGRSPEQFNRSPGLKSEPCLTRSDGGVAISLSTQSEYSVLCCRGHSNSCALLASDVTSTSHSSQLVLQTAKQTTRVVRLLASAEAD